MNTWRKWLIGAGVLVATHVVAFAFGRYLVPEKVVVQEQVKLVEVEKQVVVAQEKVRVEKVYIQEESKRIHREEHTVAHPNGMVETRKTEDINVDKVVKENGIQYVDREIIKEVEKRVDVEKVVEKRVEVQVRPDWKVTPMVGLDVPRVIQNPVAAQSAIVFGGQVERRILGPISAGAWGLSNGNAGVSVTVEF
jgi:hypothetical protein